MEVDEENVALVVVVAVKENRAARVEERVGERVECDEIDGEEVAEGVMLESAEVKGVRDIEDDEVGDCDLREDTLVEIDGLTVNTAASVREMTGVTEVDIDIDKDMRVGCVEGDATREGRDVTDKVGVGLLEGVCVAIIDPERRPDFV